MHGDPQLALFQLVDLRVLDRLKPSLEQAHLEGLGCGELADTVTVLGAGHEAQLILGRASVKLVPSAAPTPSRQLAVELSIMEQLSCLQVLLSVLEESHSRSRVDYLRRENRKID